MSTEKLRLKVCAGALPSPKIESLALDVVFPVNPDILARLESLETNYSTGRACLTEVLSAALGFVNVVEGESAILVVSTKTHDEDAWCIDPRGHLTLSVVKETYERLGLIGQKMPFKGHEGRYTIDIPLRKNGQSPAMQARVKTCLEGWDQRRAVEMPEQEGTWDVVFCAKERGQASTSPFRTTETYRVAPIKYELKDVLAPEPRLCARPSPPTKAQSKTKSDVDVDALTESADDWDRRVETLFEWVGLAALGAQRLNANDRVDPYVALYETPSPNQMQNVTHLRWRGLLPPSFVKEVLDTVQTTLESTPSPTFVSVVAHALSSSAISYMPYTYIPAANNISAALQAPTKIPLKIPRTDGEDTWCAIFERQAGGDAIRWCLGESLGQLDARWG